MKKLNIDTDRQKIVDSLVGDDVVIRDFVNIYGCSIDSGTSIGTFVEVQKNASIGKNCKVQSHTFICEGVHIADNVFIGHNVSFTNDKYPRAVNPDSSIKTDVDWQVAETFIETGVSIGTSATILSGVTIGKNTIIGAGAVVTKDIPANVIAAGNPAKIFRDLEPK
jgi:UDP-2-acetamido-3-amino-2,3-dideoxy-glucuronate N-acetyltransferase